MRKNNLVISFVTSWNIYRDNIQLGSNNGMDITVAVTISWNNEILDF